MELIDFATIHN